MDFQIDIEGGSTRDATALSAVCVWHHRQQSAGTSRYDGSKACPRTEREGGRRGGGSGAVSRSSSDAPHTAQVTPKVALDHESGSPVHSSRWRVDERGEGREGSERVSRRRQPEEVGSWPFNSTHLHRVSISRVLLPRYTRWMSTQAFSSGIRIFSACLLVVTWSGWGGGRRER